MARSSDSIFFLSLIRDKSFQAREIRRVILLSLVYLLITTALVGLFYHHMLGSLLEGMSPLLFVSEDMAMTDEALPAMSSVLGRWMLVMLGVNAAITVALSIFITRKLGQPILAIKRALRDIGNGHLDVRLRSTDKNEFGEIADELTRAMHTVRLKISAAQESMADVTSMRKNSLDTPYQNDDIDEALANCSSALEFFQVDFSGMSIAENDDQNRKVA